MVYSSKSVVIMASVLLLTSVSGVVFASSEKSKSHKDAFVCNEKTLDPQSKQSREYRENLSEQKELTRKQKKLQSDASVANNSCNRLKSKARSQCQNDVAELRDIGRTLDNLAKSIRQYESCKPVIPVVVPKCGTAINTISATEPTTNLCAAWTVVIGVTYDPTTVDALGNGMWKWRCGITGSSTGETCYASRSFVYTWSVGDWGTCVGSQQIRTVACQNNLWETVSSNNCTESMPAASQFCQMPLVTQIQSSHYNNSPVDAANMLADLGIITNYANQPTYYRVDETMNRAEYLAIILTTMGLMPSSDYQCQNIFSDISVSWICRVAETALANGLISKQTNEEGLAFFRGSTMPSLYEVLMLNLKSQCIRPESVSLSWIQWFVQDLGITNASSLSMSQVATRGDIYLSLATFYDYFNQSLVIDPSLLDSNIVSCAERMDITTKDPICVIFPGLCQ